MVVRVHWSVIVGEEHELLDDSFCLYAYFDPEPGRIVYVGHAYRHTVWERLRGEHKRNLFERVSRSGGRPFALLHGELELEPGRRRSRQLLMDVETLLIKRLAPRWNTQARSTRIARPGMVVVSLGEGPLGGRRFEDR